MKNLVILFILLWSHIATAQEYKVYKFGDPIPTVKITENNIYSYDSFGVKSDIPSIRFKGVDNSKTEVFRVNRFGVENFEPTNIDKTRPIDKQMSSEEILNKFKQRKDERIYTNRRSN